MISSVRGTVLAVSLDHAVLEVGGVGLAVQATPATLATLRSGEQAMLHTTLVVREDSLTLFGFADAQARELFVLLQTVSGIGPRLALAALAVLEPEALRSALAEGNITVLTQVPGIGKKGAERLSLELRDKVDAAPAAVSPVGDGVAHAITGGRVRTEVVEALVSLGFAAKQAEQTVDGVLGNGESDTSSVLRAALSALGKKR
ncbi:MAG: Holliday junction branch migration protein RuvA [Actinophytocola sp.]|nr:Holliday junction branch migration protein RuvA [Actinophytocola sp.]